MGDRETEDVIELYIKDNSEHSAPNPVLCGFNRVKIAAGEKIFAAIPVPEIAFTAVDDSGKRARFGTSFTLYAGTHQPDELSVKLTDTDCVNMEIK